MINLDGISVAFENYGLWQFITKTTWYLRSKCKAILNHKTGFTLIEAICDWLGAAEFRNVFKTFVKKLFSV